MITKSRLSPAILILQIGKTSIELFECLFRQQTRGLGKVLVCLWAVVQFGVKILVTSCHPKC